jgi:hypothetical protein
MPFPYQIPQEHTPQILTIHSLKILVLGFSLLLGMGMVIDLGTSSNVWRPAHSIKTTQMWALVANSNNDSQLA